MSTDHAQRETLFGHPAGLYTLFFAEMWERFSFYGMRALLVFYMTKGFLQYQDAPAITVYGAYTALVYMTPFFGGMLADKLLGARWAVVLGGTLMALGQLMMAVPNTWALFTALALLIVGNGFFKPNISTMVGSLYAQHSAKRDAGFTIFYMGINLGAAISPLLCGYIGETYGWPWGFGLATIGMLTGLAVFVMPGALARLLIMAGAIAGTGALFYFHESNVILTAINVFVGVLLLAAAAVAWVAIGRGGLPKEAGAPPRIRQGGAAERSQGMLRLAVVAGTLIAIPLFALLVSGFAPLRKSGEALVLIPEKTIKSLEKSDVPWKNTAAVVAKEASKPAGLVLVLAGLVAAAYLGFETLRLDKIPRERMFVVLILMFFVMLFWAFFEQAGSSVNLFTDRNVDRVIEPAGARVIGKADVGQTIELQPTQEQLGYTNGEKLFTIDTLAKLREANKAKDFHISWTVEGDNVGMRVAHRDDEIPASKGQAVNAIYIVVLGLVFTAIWGFLGARGLEPSTPLKFALGLLQLGLGFLSFWYGAQNADARGMVNMVWLLAGYLMHTTGELCLSPVGLAMVTKLSPKQLVSTVMGSWFLATAFSQFLAAIIAQFTSVKGSEGAAKFPAPIHTVHIYGDVFLRIAIAAIISAAICFALVPLLKRWMHEESEPS
ncbi:MAG TPA: peptide MFS transporter [Pirellulales bacterium]|jgi:POT family proton-dependent oligopeptide transporter|nr:peptide MFS transporter [Pirellulales bacterium]